MLPWSMRSSAWLLAVGLLVLFTVPLLYPSSVANRSADAAFAVIQQGATEQDVEAVLGSSSAVIYGAQGGKSLLWNVRSSNSGMVGIVVTFDSDGRVVSKATQDDPRPCSAIHRWLRRPCRPVN